jgi:hypothetical protein
MGGDCQLLCSWFPQKSIIAKQRMLEYTPTSTGIGGLNSIDNKFFYHGVHRVTRSKNNYGEHEA